jgi:hypothetical protein
MPNYVLLARLYSFLSYSLRGVDCFCTATIGSLQAFICPRALSAETGQKWGNEAIVFAPLPILCPGLLRAYKAPSSTFFTF